MKRRGLLGGIAALLVPGVALAQGAPPPDGAPPRQRRPGPAQLRYEELNQKQRQRVAHVLAGYGNPPVTPDQAASRWNMMNPNEKRAALRGYRDAMRAARGLGPGPGPGAGPGPGPGPGGAVPPMPMAPR